MRFSLGDNVPPHPTRSKSLVSKLYEKFWVRMADPWAGMVKLPQRSKTGPGRCKSTTTLSTSSGLSPVLSRRTAPASKLGPPPRKTTLGDPCQGVGKEELARRLSA